MPSTTSIYFFNHSLNRYYTLVRPLTQPGASPMGTDPLFSVFHCLTCASKGLFLGLFERLFLLNRPLHARLCLQTLSISLFILFRCILDPVGTSAIAAFLPGAWWVPILSSFLASVPCFFEKLFLLLFGRVDSHLDERQTSHTIRYFPNGHQ